ncbi:hypothetical protein QJ054_33800 [Streptomyces sp. AN-3]|uniref:hypothetical protein n=1 Tax=Streptomyces sp. AN-3 TaxID=3044177 RepID=UPI00249BABA3|nr:hypothetical protein [Streptomyces sp. AN-3]MDI3102012.1 hypothetical protein [Streptomyces sp. AN-3]
MSNDVTDGTQAEEPKTLPLTTLGLIGAVARAMEEHQKDVITPRKDAPKEPLVDAFDKEQRSDLVIKVGGEEVGRYKVATTNDRFEVEDEAAFDAFAESKGQIDIIIVRKPAWEKTVLKHAQRDPETGTIFDSRTGEVIPGLKFVPGGKPTGTVIWTWKKFKGHPIGRDVLIAAYKHGALNEYLRETPELLPKAQPGASE